jgi:hypothetical protein
MAPADAKVGPDGALYFLEYGAFFYAGANGRLSRIKCAGCNPTDPNANYGLPLDSGVPTGTPAPARSAVPAALIVGAVLVAAAGATLRRRRLIG